MFLITAVRGSAQRTGNGILLLEGLPHMSERPSMDGPKGRDLWARADAVLPGGGVYFTRSADMAGRGVLPGFIAAAQGCTVTDVDGRSYVDWLCANGPNLLGYRHPEVEAAVADELTRASTASRSTSAATRTCAPGSRPRAPTR